MIATSFIEVTPSTTSIGGMMLPALDQHQFRQVTGMGSCRVLAASGGPLPTRRGKEELVRSQAELIDFLSCSSVRVDPRAVNDAKP